MVVLKLMTQKTTLYRKGKKGAKIRGPNMGGKPKIVRNWRSLAKGQDMNTDNLKNGRGREKILCLLEEKMTEKGYTIRLV